MIWSIYFIRRLSALIPANLFSLACLSSSPCSHGLAKFSGYAITTDSMLISQTIQCNSPNRTQMSVSECNVCNVNEIILIINTHKGFIRDEIINRNTLFCL
jgi:hypothetical protein